MKSLNIKLQEASTGPIESKPFKGSVIVGKDILELLSSSMYLNPLTIFREYIQNAADGIDEAVATGKLTNASDGRIDIKIDHIKRRAVVRDNGNGLSEDEFIQRMTSIGASQKRGTTARGFRGVGRLAGLGYCQELLFRSRAQKNASVHEVKWDCRSLKVLLGSSEFNGDLEGLVRNIVSVKKLTDRDYPDHFFEVEIVNPRRIGGDRLLNEVEIERYLSQVAPCPMNPQFKFTEQIREILAPLGSASQEYNIFLNESDTPIYRPYSDSIVYSDNRIGNVDGLREIAIDSIAGDRAATGWILHHDYQGAIPTSLGIKGLRARIGNIQIGDDRIFSNVFPEDRFCSWTIGEVHITDQKILPNGRRDNFESNNHIANVITHLAPFASEIARQCRSNSQIRNRKKSFELAEQRVIEKLGIIEQGVISKSAATAHKREIGTQLSGMRQALNFELLKGNGLTELESRLLEVESLVDNSSNLAGSDDPLLAFSKVKQNVYREIFDLIYECSANGLIAKALIDRILNRLSKFSDAKITCAWLDSLNHSVELLQDCSLTLLIVDLELHRKI